MPEKDERTGNGIAEQLNREMEYLLKLLHAEWEESGAVLKTVRIPFDCIVDVEWRLNRAAVEKVTQADADTLPFEAAVDYSKECYVMVRLVKKVIEAENRWNASTEGGDFAVCLDAEEWKLYHRLILSDEK